MPAASPSSRISSAPSQSAGYGGSGSPDHADAAIWALTYLFELGDGSGIIEFYRREVDGAR